MKFQIPNLPINVDIETKPHVWNLGFQPGIIYYFLVAFFLPATVLRLPLRVRLLVRVR